MTARVATVPEWQALIDQLRTRGAPAGLLEMLGRGAVASWQTEGGESLMPPPELAGGVAHAAPTVTRSAGGAPDATPPGQVPMSALTALSAHTRALEEQIRRRDLEELIARGRAAGKITPAMSDWCATLTLEQLRGFIAVAPAHHALTTRYLEPAHAATTLTHDGKSWGELSPSEKHALYEDNHDLYVAMSSDAART